MKTKELKQLEENTLANNNIAKIFRNGELVRTFDTNPEAVSYLKNTAFTTKGIYEDANDTITVTTPNGNVFTVKFI